MAHSTCTKNTSRYCKIRATSLLSYLMNTVSLAALPVSTYPIHHHHDSLAQSAVSRCDGWCYKSLICLIPIFIPFSLPHNKTFSKYCYNGVFTWLTACCNTAIDTIVRSFHQGRRLTVGSLSTCLQLPPALTPRHGPVRNSPLTLRLVLYIYRA